MFGDHNSYITGFKLPYGWYTHGLEAWGYKNYNPRIENYHAFWQVAEIFPELNHQKTETWKYSYGM